MQAVISTFRTEFDRFHNLLVEQIGICPSEEAWNETTGRFAYWWHLFHALALVEAYALPPGASSRQKYFPADVVFAKAEPDHAMTREEMRAFAADMKELAYAFFEAQSEKTLMEKNEGMSKALGRESTNLNALIGLIRHHCYHIGAVDSLLRRSGVSGVL